MRLLLTVAFLATACAVPAIADIPMPDPSKCTKPSFIVLVGHDGLSADPSGAFSVAVRDFNNNPIPNSMVTVSFADCPYVRICSSQNPNLHVNCPARMVSAITQVQGVATLAIVGAAVPASCPSDASGCAKLYADGILLGSVSVATLDLDGVPGLSGEDLSAWLEGYFCGSQSPRLDYTGFGVDGGDLSPWLGAFFRAGSAQGCSGPSCN